jgi:hypothetical protein
VLRARAATGWTRLAFAFVHVAILAAGLAGLATFAVSMSEATPAPRDVPVLAQVEPAAEPAAAADGAAEPTNARTVRVVYPGLGR